MCLYSGLQSTCEQGKEIGLLHTDMATLLAVPATTWGTSMVKAWITFQPIQWSRREWY